MRYVIFLTFFIFATAISAKEVKIVLSSLDSEQRAQKKLEKFQNEISSEFKAFHAKEGFDVLIRPSGKKYYILTIEPVKDKKTAREIQKLLPKPYDSDSFVGNYSLPKRYETTHKIPISKAIDANMTSSDVLEQEADKQIPKEVKEAKEKEQPTDDVALEADEKRSQATKEEKEQTSQIDTSKEEVVALPQEPKVEDEIAQAKETDKSVPEVSIQEEAKTEEAKTEEAKTEEIKTEEIKTEEIKTEEIKTEEIKTEEIKTEEIKTEEIKTEEIKTEEVSQPKEVVVEKDEATSQVDEATKEKADPEKIDANEMIHDSFAVGMIDDIGSFFELSKQFIKSFFTSFSRFIVSHLFEVALIVLLVALVLFVLAYKKSILLYKKIDWLKAKNHETAKDTEFLKLDIANLKAYFNTLVESAKPSLEKLEEHFHARQASIEEKEAKDAVHFLTHIIRTHEDFGGNIILSPKEFDFNLLVKRVLASADIKILDTTIIQDFDSPMLKRVIGDSQKIGRVLASLITFCCNHTKNCRILIVLNEVVQDAQGNIDIKIIIKNSKDSFSKEVLKKISKAFTEQERVQEEPYSKDVLDLITARRTIEAMGGQVQVLENFRGDSGFVFDVKLKVINRRTIQKNIFSTDSFIKLSILIFGNNAESVRALQSELEFFNMNVETCFSWNRMIDSFNDIYFFIDMVIVQNATLPFVDIEALNDASRKKNFVTIVVLEEHENESDELKQVENKKTLKRPYEKEGLARMLDALSKEQRPAIINS